MVQFNVKKPVNIADIANGNTGSTQPETVEKVEVSFKKTGVPVLTQEDRDVMRSLNLNPDDAAHVQQWNSMPPELKQKAYDDFYSNPANQYSGDNTEKPKEQATSANSVAKPATTKTAKGKAAATGAAVAATVAKAKQGEVPVAPELDTPSQDESAEPVEKNKPAVVTDEKRPTTGNKKPEVAATAKKPAAETSLATSRIRKIDQPLEKQKSNLASVSTGAEALSDAGEIKISKEVQELQDKNNRENAKKYITEDNWKNLSVEDRISVVKNFFKSKFEGKSKEEINSSITNFLNDVVKKRNNISDEEWNRYSERKQERLRKNVALSYDVAIKNGYTDEEMANITASEILEAREKASLGKFDKSLQNILSDANLSDEQRLNYISEYQKTGTIDLDKLVEEAGLSGETYTDLKKVMKARQKVVARSERIEQESQRMNEASLRLALHDGVATPDSASADYLADHPDMTFDKIPYGQALDLVGKDLDKLRAANASDLSQEDKIKVFENWISQYGEMASGKTYYSLLKEQIGNIKNPEERAQINELLDTAMGSTHKTIGAELGKGRELDAELRKKQNGSAAFMDARLKDYADKGGMGKTVSTALLAAFSSASYATLKKEFEELSRRPIESLTPEEKQKLEDYKKVVAYYDSITENSKVAANKSESAEVRLDVSHALNKYTDSKDTYERIYKGKSSEERLWATEEFKKNVDNGEYSPKRVKTIDFEALLAAEEGQEPDAELQEKGAKILYSTTKAEAVIDEKMRTMVQKGQIHKDVENTVVALGMEDSQHYSAEEKRESQMGWAATVQYMHQDNQLKGYQSVMTSDIEDVRKFATENIVNFHESVQADALEFAVNTGEDAVIETAASVANEITAQRALEGKSNDDISKSQTIQNAIRDTEVKHTASIAAVLAKDAVDKNRYSNDPNTAGMTKEQKQEYYKELIQNDSRAFEIFLKDYLPNCSEGTKKSVYIQIAKYCPNMLKSIAGSYGADILKMSGTLPLGVICIVANAMLEAGGSARRVAANFICSHDDYFSNIAIERAEEIVNGKQTKVHEAPTAEHNYSTVPQDVAINHRYINGSLSTNVDPRKMREIEHLPPYRA